jgi:hypothetical protein
VAAVQLSGSSKGTVERSEHHRKHNAKGSMEAADGIGEGSRVLGHGAGDPGMRQLKEQGTTGAQKNDGFSIDPPGHRRRTKNAFDRSGGPRPDGFKGSLQVAFGDQMRTFGKARGQVYHASRQSIAIRCIGEISKASSAALASTA